MATRPAKRGRLTSVAAQFVHAIIPRQDDAAARLGAYCDAGIDPKECVYCGSQATDLDHFRPIVKAGKPSGNFHTTYNLVPSCGRCNQSKGGQDWKTWMTGPAPGSPATRGITDLPERVAKLQKFADRASASCMSLDEMRDAVGPDLWDSYWRHVTAIEETMVKAQAEADELRPRLEEAFADFNALHSGQCDREVKV